ncbi:MAG: hypothetical protein JWP89_1324 [Schlesneria sp.]|nr:hypothetical protein [Schlesneria sp.]
MVAVHTALVMWSSLIHSPNVNEVAHLTSGVCHWQLGRFDFYRVNPPMVRMVAAIPAVAMNCQTDWSKNLEYSRRPGSRPEFRVVPRFVELNGKWAYWYIVWGRLMCLPFSWVGAWVCFRWADEIYGRWSALLSTALWCFSPNELALSSFMTPDGVASSLGVAAGYAYWRWLYCPTWDRAISTGIMLGLALLSKLTWIILLGLWPLIGLIVLIKTWAMTRKWSYVTQLSTSLIIGVYLLNCGYLFDGTFKRLGDYQFVSRVLTSGDETTQDNGWGNRFRESIFGRIALPFPEQYVLGCDIQKADFEQPRRTYFRGQMYGHGLWYYYIYALAVKTPLGVFFISLVAMLQRKRLIPSRSNEWVLPAHFLFFLAVVSAETSWNAHLRYALPAMPFALIWTSRAALVFAGGQRLLSLILASSCGWFICSSLWFSTHSLSYFNELAGGPAAGHEHLIDSNVDWGQDLLLLKHWLDRHPDIGRIGLAYYGHFNPRAFDIDFFIPEGDLTTKRQFGWYVISATMLHGTDCWLNGPDGKQQWSQADGFTDFLARTPTERIGYSLFVYQIP